MRYQNHPGVQMGAHAVLSGQVIAYPTEAVWGLGCDPFNRYACAQILALKRRPLHKGVILVAANMGQVEFLLEGLEDSLLQRLTESWPGPNTWLVPHHNRVPEWICGRHQSVAIRISAHPVVKALCELVGGPLVSTSANPQAMAPARSALRARIYFGDNVVYVPGQVDRTARPSRIRDLITGATLRS